MENKAGRKEYALPEREVRLKTDEVRFYKSSRQIITPDDAVAVLAEELKQRPYEKCLAVFMDNKGHPVCCQTVGLGNAGFAYVSIAKLAQMALLTNSFNVILMHNHTSIHPEIMPSRADITMTEKTEKALELLEIQLVDHIIVGGSGERFSFRAHNMLSSRASGTIAAEG